MTGNYAWPVASCRRARVRAIYGGPNLRHREIRASASGRRAWASRRVRCALAKNQSSPRPRAPRLPRTTANGQRGSPQERPRRRMAKQPERALRPDEAVPARGAGASRLECGPRFTDHRVRQARAAHVRSKHPCSRARGAQRARRIRTASARRGAGFRCPNPGSAELLRAMSR